MIVSGGEQFSVSAKARVRKGTLLDGEFFSRLLECTHISDIARMLRATYYGKYLPADVETFHRDKFEYILMSVISSEVQSFFSSAGLLRNAFLKLWLERQDIQLMKNRIWDIYAEKDSDYEEKAVNESYKELSSFNFSLVDEQKLLSSNRIDEVIYSIKNEKLVAHIEDAMKRSVGGTSPALMMGFALDAFHNNRVFDAAKSFRGEEKEKLLSLTGIYMDVNNITSIYRGKKYFNMSEEVTLSLLYTRYRADFEILKAIAALPPERMWAPLAGTRYASLLPVEGRKDEISDPAGITSRMRSIQRKGALEVFFSGSAGIHFVLAYLILRELEILDISAIIEIVRYNYDRKKAEKLLAYPMRQGGE
ncbi:MAG: V-type ATPase subunit [Synergistaceae bacterium]|nr:V-type ATPase subunit [Synergistaceae bacterium]